MAIDKALLVHQRALNESDHEKRHGRDTFWALKTKDTPQHIKINWPRSAWIVDAFISKNTRKENPRVRHLFLTSLWTTHTKRTAGYDLLTLEH